MVSVAVRDISETDNLGELHKIIKIRGHMDGMESSTGNAFRPQLKYVVLNEPFPNSSNLVKFVLLAPVLLHRM